MEKLISSDVVAESHPEQQRIEQGYDTQRQDRGEDQSEDDRDRHGLSHGSRAQVKRNEPTHRCCGGEENGPQSPLGGLEHRPGRRMAVVPNLDLDPVDEDDGVVDDDAGERDDAQRVMKPK